MRLTPSFRTKILLIVLVVAVVPLGLIGLWLTRATVRSGEELLRSRLNEALEVTVLRIGANWIRQRSDLLSLAEGQDAQRALRVRRETEVPSSLERRFKDLDPGVDAAIVRDANGRDLWTLRRASFSDSRGGELEGRSVPVDLGIYDRATGERLGTLEIRLDVTTLLGGAGAIPTTAGMVLGAFDPYTGASLLPLPFDPTLLSGDRFAWGGDDWLTARRGLTDPPVELVAAAPLAPFTQPFEGAARRGTSLLLAVAIAAFLLTVGLTTRLTRSLGRLAEAADAVSRGDLERKVEEKGEDEVGRLARAFNTMTQSLQRTLRELADREALAAVGEFAASLAHEVRNPLTSIRVDLQWVEESLPDGSPLREVQGRALQEIGRLDDTVSDALTVARSGRIQTRTVDVFAPLEAAIHAAEPAFEERGATLEPPRAEATPIHVLGDDTSLGRVFLNLLLNAAQALNAGGSAEVEVRVEDGTVAVSIRDTGGGIPQEDLPRIFEPFFSTRPGGTGLGLAIARRIVTAHGGELHIDSVPGAGTTAQVRLPVLS